MIGFLFNIVTGPQKLLWIVGGIAVGLTTFWGWLQVHDYNIKEQAIIEFNAAQEKVLAEKKAEYERKIEELRKEADKLRADAKTAEDKLRDTITDIERGIEAKGGNRPAPKYIREVVDKMQKNFGEPKK